MKRSIINPQSMPTTKNTKVSEEFKVGKNDIGYVSSTFLDLFGDMSLESGAVLTSQKLPRRMSDFEIIEELNVQECTLSDVLETLKTAQLLLRDGNWNLFYIKDSDRVVRVRWFDGGWRVDDWGRRERAWRGGIRVFSLATDSKTLGSTDPRSLSLETLHARIKELEEWKNRCQK